MHRIFALISAAIFLAASIPSAILAGQAPAPPAKRPLMLEDLLPPHAILYLRTPHLASFKKSMEDTAIGRIGAHPEVGEFVEETKAKWGMFVDRITAESKADRAIVESIMDSQISFGLVGIDPSTGGTQHCLGFRFINAPEREKLYDTLKEIAWSRLSNKIPAQQISVQGITVLNLPIPGSENAIFREENYFVLLENLLIAAHSRPVIEAAVGRYLARGSMPSLSGAPVFKTVLRGTAAQPGSGFAFVNTGIAIPIMQVFASPQMVNLLAVLGLTGVQGVGCGMDFVGEGVRHTVYLHAPGQRQGILRVLALSEGAEGAAALLPEETRSFFAARVNLVHLYREVPRLVDAVRATAGVEAESATGLSVLAGNQEILGVPAAEVLATLGDSIVLQDGPAGTAIRFTRANPATFEKSIARMEKSLGTPFTTVAEGQRVLRYFNQSGQPVPAAPAYVILDRSTVLIASHPQVIKSILRQKQGRALVRNRDFLRAIAGMPQGLGMISYVNSADSYARVYDALMPFANVLTAYPALGVDPGLLPPGGELHQHFFGHTIGIKNTREGLTLLAYSPLGVVGPVVYALDEMVVNNPATMGLAAAAVLRFFNARDSVSAQDVHAPLPPPAAKPGPVTINPDQP